MIAFAAVCRLRRSLRTSPVFEPSWIGLLITAIGYSGGLFKMFAGPDLTSGFDFPFALLTGCALAFSCGTPLSGRPIGRPPRPLWVVGLIVALLGL